MSSLLLKADEHPKGSPFDHYTKLQLLIQKGKSEEGIRWAFSSVSPCSKAWSVLVIDVHFLILYL